MDDARVTAEVFLKLAGLMKKQGIHTLKEMNEKGGASPELIRKMPTWHGIILSAIQGAVLYLATVLGLKRGLNLE